MAITRFDVEFTRDGHVHNPTQAQALLNGLSGVTDLLVLSHGWNNDMAEARHLYDTLLSNVERLLAIAGDANAPGSLRKLAVRQFAACQIFWPSKKFAESELIPGGGAASATTETNASASHALDQLKDDPERLGERAVDAARAAAIERAKALLPMLDASPNARKEYVHLLRSLLADDEAHDEDGSSSFFSENPETLFENLAGGVVAPVGPGASARVGAGQGAAGFSDMFNGPVAAARRLANFATYYQMKQRAGVVGSTGVAPLLKKCREKHPDLRLHLVGHSFGGRLVTAAAHALDANQEAVTVSLLQAAFSHNAFSADFDGSGQAGSFREVIGPSTRAHALRAGRVSGPIIITHTKNDTAVGIAYPLVSRIARQNAAALGDANDPYGGMGRNGAQRTQEADGNAGQLGQVGAAYTFTPGRIYNLNADQIIKNHGDVTGMQVAYAVLCAAAAV